DRVASVHHVRQRSPEASIETVRQRRRLVRTRHVRKPRSDTGRSRTFEAGLGQSARGREAMSTRTKVIIGIVALIVSINLVLGAIDRVVGGPRGGPVSSSFNSSEKGLAAYADLLRQDGHRVRQLRKSLATTRLDPGSTVVVLDANVDAKDAQALRSFVLAGGRLICGGLISQWMNNLLDDP